MSDPGRPARLHELADGARAAGRLALDTEFMGEGRYRTLLCLVQLAIPEGQGPDERIMILDPLDGDLDASPLTEVLADPAVRVVVHAGRQDVALLRRRFRTEIANVFDTQVAAGFAGLGAQSSYDSLLTSLLGLRLAKTASFTRWDTRPLSAEQVAYAREDVVHLLELADVLEGRLQELGRLQWALEECEPVAQSSDERDPVAILRRLPRVAGLGARATTVARELVEWREAVAERQDRPIQSVLSDATLVELARRSPGSREALGRIRGLGGNAGGRRGAELLEVIRRGAQRPADTVSVSPRAPSPKPDDPPLVALAEALVRARAREAGLAYELIATRAELQAVVTAARSGTGADARTLRGWRREVAGEALLELLEGRSSLTVTGRGPDVRVQVAPADGGGEA
ncbi:MAG TPA: HRDC domain-containing protein [Solirubrobacteraceae bacterium]|nr:HRDC domain-containing protein [Solirubrobacteraceae bacterium]